jgi:hypothetical protein
MPGVGGLRRRDEGGRDGLAFRERLAQRGEQHLVGVGLAGG